MTTWITICDTCKREDWDATVHARAHGEDLAERIERAAEDHATLRTRRVSCLMGCGKGCNIAIQGAGKLAYTLGDFAPDDAAAEAIVAYAALHAESETGQVPYKQWPQGVKGHFVTRHPPLPADPKV